MPTDDTLEAAIAAVLDRFPPLSRPKRKRLLDPLRLLWADVDDDLRPALLLLIVKILEAHFALETVKNAIWAEILEGRRDELALLQAIAHDEGLTREDFTRLLYGVADGEKPTGTLVVRSRGVSMMTDSPPCQPLASREEHDREKAIREGRMNAGHDDDSYSSR